MTTTTTTDAKKLTPVQLRKIARERFLRSRRAAAEYERQLGKLGSSIEALIKKYAPNGVLKKTEPLRRALNAYSETIRPWAESVTAKMHNEVAQRDETAWFESARAMGRTLRGQLEKAPVGSALRDMLSEQVGFITSLPREAAKRVHRLTIRGLASGQRPETIAKEILKTGAASVRRARLIARTEVARTSATLVEVRARHIGSEGYIWRTANDSDVRPALGTPDFAILNTLAKGSHRKLEGTFHRWDSPPIAAPNGERSHPGCIFNCRCWAEPVLPDKI